MSRRLPSVKTLESIGKGTPPQTATAVRRVLEQFDGRMHSNVGTYALVDEIDRILGANGARDLLLDNDWHVVFCDLGDTYARTLYAVGKPLGWGGRLWTWHVGAWGDLVERYGAE